MNANLKLDINCTHIHHLWSEKVTKTVGHSLQSDSTEEENDQNDVWKCGSHIHDL